MMARKNRPAEVEPAEVPLKEEREDAVEDIVVPVVTADVLAHPAKKPLGVKEVIPFKWKLIGQSQGMTLTLFKAVELEDVEAQRERLHKEGFYADLRILDADAKVEQPKTAKSLKSKETKAKSGEKAEKVDARPIRGAKTESRSTKTTSVAPPLKVEAKSSRTKPASTKRATKKKA